MKRFVNVYNKKPLDKIFCEVYNESKESKEFKTTGGIIEWNFLVFLQKDR